MIEEFMETARRHALSYLAMLPFYLLFYIFFMKHEPDPLGRYDYLIWTGKAKYD